MSSSDIAIRVENLGKMYRLGREIPHAETLGGKLRQALAAPFGWLVTQMREPGEDEILWALKDVSFEVKRGEVVGIIGHNGAGKSTLLKILSRITEPTEGFAEIHGRIAALLEVGTGMHPELTGRENIYMNGTVLGMKKREIDRKFGEIVEFSGIEKFIDTPVKRYSSGMRVRLGFAIAAHLEPEILVVDEVLAVGDVDFRKKCLDKMDAVAKGGRTVLFVSHNMGAIRNLCERAFLMKNGAIAYTGTAKSTIDVYTEDVCESSDNALENCARSGTGEVRFVDFFVEDKHGRRLERVFSGEDVTFVFVVDVDAQRACKIDVGFSLHKLDGDPLANLCCSYNGGYYDLSKGRHKIFCDLTSFPFSPGKLRVRGRITSNGIETDWPKCDLGMIKIEMGDYYGTGSLGNIGYAPCLLRGTWKDLK